MSSIKLNSLAKTKPLTHQMRRIIAALMQNYVMLKYTKLVHRNPWRR